MMLRKSTNSPTDHDPELEGFVEEESVDLRHYWYVVTKYKWGIFGLVVAAALFTTVLAFSMQPIYRSTATLLIGGNESLMGNSEAQDDSRLAREKFLGTQFELLRSRQIAEAAVAKLEQDQNTWLKLSKQHESGGSSWWDWMPRSWFLNPSAHYAPVAEADPNSELLRWIWDNLSIEPVRDTAMVKVSFESPDPSLAALMANAVAQAYIETNLADRRTSSQDASDWLKGQLAQAQEAMAESIDTLQRYREQTGLINVEGMQSVFTEQLKTVSAELAHAANVRTEAENLYQRAQRLQATGQMEALPVIFENPWVQRLRAQEEELEREIRLNSERFQGSYPGLDAAQQRLMAVREQIDLAFTHILDGIKTEYEVARDNEAYLQSTLTGLQEKVQEQNRKELQVAALERVVESNRQGYDAFLSRLMDTSTRAADTVSLIARVVDRATPESVPFKPHKKRMLMVAMLLALMAGVGLAFLLDRLDNTVKSREDLEDRLGLPVLGEVTRLRQSQQDNTSLTPVTIFLNAPTSLFSENIRTIRTGVALSGLDQSDRVIVVTSTVTGEGKSTVSMNLALALAQLGNVLLIDADLRRPSLAKSCGMEGDTAGLTDFVAGTAKILQCVHRLPGDVHLLPAGSTLPPDPLAVLSAERFAELIEKSAAAYDSVVIDSPPVELVSDARVLAAQATGIVYVMKADDTPYQLARQGIKNLSKTGTPIIGAVLNQVDPKKTASYGKYGKYGAYYSRYGYSAAAS